MLTFTNFARFGQFKVKMIDFELKFQSLHQFLVNFYQELKILANLCLILEKKFIYTKKFNFFATYFTNFNILHSIFAMGLELKLKN